MTAAEVVSLGLQAAESEALKSGAIPGYSLMAQGVLDALKAAGYAVIELPKRCPVPTPWGQDCLGAWPVTGDNEPVSAWPDGRVVTPDDKWMPAAEAQSLGAALLAAASEFDQ